MIPGPVSISISQDRWEMLEILATATFSRPENVVDDILIRGLHERLTDEILDRHNDRIRCRVNDFLEPE